MARKWTMTRWLATMNIEQDILRGVALADIYLMECWKWLLVILLVMGIGTLVFVNAKWK